VKKLKVTWMNGSWTDGVDQTITSAEVHVQARISLLGETVVVQDPGSMEVVLVIPENRLISAVQVEVGDTDA